MALLEVKASTVSTRESWQKLKANRIPPNVIKRLDCQVKMEHKSSPFTKRRGSPLPRPGFTFTAVYLTWLDESAPSVCQWRTEWTPPAKCNTIHSFERIQMAWDQKSTERKEIIWTYKHEEPWWIHKVVLSNASSTIKSIVRFTRVLYESGLRWSGNMTAHNLILFIVLHVLVTNRDSLPLLTQFTQKTHGCSICQDPVIPPWQLIVTQSKRPKYESTAASAQTDTHPSQQSNTVQRLQGSVDTLWCGHQLSCND